MGPRGCELFRAFAHGKYSSGLADEERAAIRTGRCPKRSNGTFAVGMGGPFRSIDISKQAASEAGQAVLDGIDAYIAEYPLDAS
jgi:hypothetical protein